MNNLSFFILTLLIMLINCSCDNTVNNTSNTPEPIEVKASINTNEIGGSDLSIKSVYKENSTNQNNEFSTIVSSKGTQLLFIYDNKQQLRGFTLSIITNNKPVVMQSDAKSTAISMLMMTPGILTTVPTETESVLNNFKNLKNLPKLIDFLKSNLPSKSLSVILGEAQVRNLLDSCILEYKQSFKSIVQKKKQVELLFERKFMFEIDQKVVNSKWSVDFANYGWRYINIYRRDLGSQNELNVEPVLKSMGGAIPLSWGSLFFVHTVNNPTKDKDNNYNLATDVLKSEYWIIGPGFNNANKEIPPSSMNTEYYDALGQSIVHYMLFPVIDLITGGATLVSSGSNLALQVTKTVWNGVKTSVSLSNVYQKDLDLISLTRELTNVTIAMLGVGLSTGILVEAGYISAATAASLAQILAVSTVVMASSNSIVFALNLFEYPESYKLVVFNQDASFPSFDDIQPKSGKIGSNVVLKGKGFGATQNASYVLFNDIKVESYLSWSNTEIQCVVPNSTGSNLVCVVINGIKTNYLGFTITDGTVNGSCQQVPYCFSLGTMINGRQAHGNDGPIKCDRNYWLDGMGCQFADFMSGRGWYNIGPVTKNSASVTFKWIDDSWFGGNKKVQIYNFTSNTWEDVKTFTQVGEDRTDTYSFSISNNNLDNNKSIRIAFWADGSAVIHIHHLSVN